MVILRDIRFSGKLYYTTDNIDFISVLRNKNYTVPYKNGKDRYSVIFVEKGEMLYSFQKLHKSISLSKGMVLFIPKNIPYVAEYTGDNTLMKLLVFNIISDDLPDIFCRPFDKYSSGISDIFHSINSSNSNNTIFLAAKIYELLYIFEKESKVIANKFKKILPALNEVNQLYFENKKLSYYADLCSISQSNFRKLFKEYTGQSFIDYRNTIRVHEAKKLIDNEVMTKTEAAYLCGFNNMSFFYKVYNKFNGCI